MSWYKYTDNLKILFGLYVCIKITYLILKIFCRTPCFHLSVQLSFDHESHVCRLFEIGVKTIGEIDELVDVHLFCSKNGQMFKTAKIDVQNFND